MSAEDYFNRVGTAERSSRWIFRGVLLFSVIGLVVPEDWIQRVVNPGLILFCFLGFLLGIFTSACQNEGNQLLRATQLTNAFDVPLGAPARESYYNNSFPPTIDRLAATTLENSLFTSKILQHMLLKERCLLVLWVSVFIITLAFRWSSTNFLLVLAQTVFSVDVALHWFRMERLNHRVRRVHESLRQLFIQGGIGDKQTGIAIALAEFSNYECAKDEAGIPLDGRTFKRLNPEVSKEWEEMRKALKIP